MLEFKVLTRGGVPKSLSLVTSFRCHLGIVRSVGDTIYVGFEGPFVWPERLDYI